MDIAILGMGRLGRTLARLLPQAGHRVRTWSRGAPIPVAELTWVTVSDPAIAQVARMIPPGSVVLHASGLLDVDVLRPHAPAGSLHPVQTFPGPEVSIPDLAGVAAVLSGDPAAREVAAAVATSLGMIPTPFDGDRRLHHASCVLVGNLLGVVVAAAKEAAIVAGFSKDQVPLVLGPLAHQALENALTTDLSQVLTGPFARGDHATIDLHRAALAEHAPHLLPLYEALASHTRSSRRGEGA